MTLRIVTTPIRPTVEWPSARAGGLDPALLEAIIPAPELGPVLSKLRAPDVLFVTTGQQPGLFTGPLYTIHKALSARALASHLEARWGRPVVPLFWLANDDHDFAEASSAAWIGAGGNVVERALPPRAATAPQLPMYRTPLPAEISGIVAELVADLKAHQFGGKVADWVTRHWIPGATIGAAYSASLGELLAPLGIPVFDSTHRTAKRTMARHLIKALGLSLDLDRDLADRAKELRAAGQDGGVPVGDGATLVMLEGKEGRDRLVMEGSAFKTRRSEERFTLEALQRLAAEAPERFSPNVLLRPVVEASILPTVAYVAGPGELKYWQLTAPIFGRMRVTPQAAVPRWSGVIVEPRVERAILDFESSIEELTGPTGPLEARLARATMPAPATAAFDDLREAIARDLALLGGEGEKVTPQLERALDSLRRRLEWTADRAEQKFVAHLKRQDTETMTRVARARDAVRPLGRPQERTLTIASFLARYGHGLLDEIGQAAFDWYASALEGGVPST